MLRDPIVTVLSVTTFSVCPTTVSVVQRTEKRSAVAAAPVETSVDAATVQWVVDTNVPQELRIDGGVPLFLGDEPHVLHP